MYESEWRLVRTLADVPSAQSLAEVLAADGVAVRVSSEVAVLGQAAPARLYVGAAHLHRAQSLLAERQFSDEELTKLATAQPPASER
jgi:hypothetical protein